MCTLTWFANSDGYELFFNRDERWSRGRAELPSIQREDSISFISPTDSDAGGTWIAANHFGVTVCLLNHYQFEQIATYQEWVSRGEIVRRFATISDLVSAQRCFAKLELKDYRAFRMFVIDQFGDNLLLVWDGHAPRIETKVSRPKSSSSVDASNVKSRRKDLFRQLGLESSKSSSDFIKYHKGHLPEQSQTSVCMHRDDANTVSLSHVVVSAGEVRFSYADGQPCVSDLQAPLIIQRRGFAE